MKRQWTSWEKWEDYKVNFYGGMIDNWQRDDTLELYAGLLRDLPRFEAALKRITSEWKHCLAHNLSHEGMNRLAYLGQAACALLYNVPHKVSMSGYQLLTDAEKIAADAMAQKYLDLWLKSHGDQMDLPGVVDVGA